MYQNYTAIYKKNRGWYLGWIEEVPGVNTQGKTLKEVRENLNEALSLILEVNKELLRKAIPGKTIRETVTIQRRPNETERAYSIS
ncbi:type II toxin-antitoxin system HicB family antitoxin [Candidatus Uhrbacteria bacterium]|nr:type II toxin-antitoxin system HicB family antitoxin [Candidatus Uhrbacteria bacterium]